MRVVVLIVVLGLALVSCGGSSGEPGDGTAVGPGATTTSLGDGSTAGGDGPDTSISSSGSNPECAADEICETDFVLDEIAAGGDELEEIAISGSTAYVTTDAGAVVVIDLAGRSVEATHALDPMAIDVAVWGDEVWVLTLDGPARLDPGTGSLSNQGLLPSRGSGSHLAVDDIAVWVTTNGTGEVTGFDKATGEVIGTVTDYDNLSTSGTARVVVADGEVWSVDEHGGRVLRIDPSTLTIIEAFQDLGYEATESGGSTSIVAPGPASLVTAEDSIWVLSNLANPEGEFVTGIGAVYRIDAASGSAEEVFDLLGDPEQGSSFVVGDDAIWYLELTSNDMIRVDRATGLQYRLRAGYVSGNGLAMGDGVIWMTGGTSLFGADVSLAADVMGP